MSPWSFCIHSIVNKILFPAQEYFELPPVDALKFGDLVAIDLSASTNSYTHGLHRYPAKFIPQIPRWAIRQYTQAGDTVLDPFSGSGTTIVEAVAEQRSAIGIDLDPLACAIGGAKTAALDPVKIGRAGADALRAAVSWSGALRVPLAGVKNFDHWFSPSAWRDLQALKEAIDASPCTEVERRFLLVVFSSIVRAVSNADDQTQKTYVSGTLKKVPPDVFPTFEKRLSKAIGAISQLNSHMGEFSARAINASASEMPIATGSIDLIVTSPPYLDSVDYPYNLMLEYFWLGKDLGIKSRDDYNSLRRSSIGSKSPVRRNDVPDYIENLVSIQDVPNYRKAAVGPYFTGMLEHFREANRVLTNDGHYVLVIGNSRTQQGMLPLHDALVQLASSVGLQMDHAFGYRIRRHYMKFPRQGRGGIILMDWVITFRKAKGKLEQPPRLPMIDAQLSPDAVAN